MTSIANLPYLALDRLNEIPEQLRESPQWIAWASGPVDPVTGKFSKFPKAADGTGRSWQKPEQWMKFADAVEMATRRGLAGVGIVLPAQISGHHVVVFDHDYLDFNDQQRMRAITDLWEELGQPYSETSPSGHGLRMFALSDISVPQVTRNGANGAKDELFCASGKWVTVTGDVYASGGLPIATDAILKVYKEWQTKTTLPTGEGALPLRREAGSAGLLGHLAQSRFAWPDHKLHDGEDREKWMLSYAGWLRKQDHAQDAIERLCLIANQEQFAEQLDDAIVLDRSRRYEQATTGAKVATDRTAQPWGDLQPLPPKYHSPPRLDPSLLPGALADYVLDAAQRMQVPPEMIATPLLISLGSVIGKKLAVQPMQQNFEWTEYPNLWGVAVLPPAMLKSPALNAGARCLQELEGEAQRQHAIAITQWESEERVRRLEIDHKQGQAKTAIKNNQRGEARRLLDEIQEIKPPRRTRYIVQDATPEARLEILTENPNGCMLIRDEFDGHMAQLRREGYENARAQELQFYDGKQDYANDRIKRGSSVADSPRLAVYGNLQPSKVEKYLRELKHGGNDDGYVQRLFQLGIQPSIDAAYELIDTKPDQQAEARVRAVFSAAARLPLGRDPLTARISPRLLKFDTRAQQTFNAFLIDLEKKLRGGDIPNPMQAAHVGKARGTLPKLALIVAFAANPDATLIDSDALDRAMALLAFYSLHAKRIYAVETRGDMVSAHELLARIKKGAVPDGFNPRDDVMRREWDGLTKAAEIEGAIAILVKHGYIRDTEVPTSGRPRRLILVHPDALPDKSGRK